VNSFSFINTTGKHWQQRQSVSVRFNEKRFEMNDIDMTSQGGDS
jgi:hypothetical protein